MSETSPEPITSRPPISAKESGPEHISARELFEILVREHETRLRAFLFALVRDPGAVDDLIQDSFLVAWRNLDRYDRALPFGPWLRGIARRLSLAHYRKRGAEKIDFLEHEAVVELAKLHVAFETTSGDTLDEQLSSLETCLSKLPPHQRCVLRLHYEEDLGCREIAEKIGRSREAVKKLLQRSRAWLGQCIKQRMTALGTASASDITELGTR